MGCAQRQRCKSSQANISILSSGLGLQSHQICRKENPFIINFHIVTWDLSGLWTAFFFKKKWIRIKWKVWHLMLSSLQTTCLSYLPVCGHGLPSSPLLLPLLVRGPGTCPPGSVYFPLFWSLLPVSTYCSLIQGVFTSPTVCQAPHWVLVLSKCSSLSSLDNCFSEEQRFKSVFSTSHSAWHTERHSKWLRTVVLVFRIILLNKFNWWLGEGHPVLSW